jgi:F0F1-type ATP synthase assembly protein I
MDLDYDLNMFEAVKLLYINSFRSMLSILLGGIVFALPLAIAAYFSALFLYRKRRKGRNNRIIKTKH